MTTADNINRKALEEIQDRSAKGAAHLMARAAFPEYLGRRTECSVRDAKLAIEMLEVMFVTHKSRTRNLADICFVSKEWVGEFEAACFEENPTFGPLECIQVLEKFVSGAPLTRESVLDAVHLLLDLMAKARKSMPSYLGF